MPRNPHHLPHDRLVDSVERITHLTTSSNLTSSHSFVSARSHSSPPRVKFAALVRPSGGFDEVVSVEQPEAPIGALGSEPAELLSSVHIASRTGRAMRAVPALKTTICWSDNFDFVTPAAAMTVTRVTPPVP